MQIESIALRTMITGWTSKAVHVLPAITLGLALSFAPQQLRKGDATLSIHFVYGELFAADRRGGRSIDRGGRAGGMGSDRRGDVSGKSDRSEKTSGGNSSSNSGATGSDEVAEKADSAASKGETAQAEQSGRGRDSQDAEGGDRGYRTWFNIDSADAEMLNIGVVLGGSAPAQTDQPVETCASLKCVDRQ